jgi:hypothetical protein
MRDELQLNLRLTQSDPVKPSGVGGRAQENPHGLIVLSKSKLSDSFSPSFAPLNTFPSSSSAEFEPANISYFLFFGPVWCPFVSSSQNNCKKRRGPPLLGTAKRVRRAGNFPHRWYFIPSSLVPPNSSGGVPCCRRWIRRWIP